MTVTSAAKPECCASTSKGGAISPSTVKEPQLTQTVSFKRSLNKRKFLYTGPKHQATGQNKMKKENSLTEKMGD